MNAVLGLPGRNPETEGWLTALMRALGNAEAEVARYAHWQHGGDPDVAAEAATYPVAERTLVVAKSMGTMVLLAAVEKGDPARAVLIGTPVDVYSPAQVEALKALSVRVPCLFIQQTDDFTGRAANLRVVLGAEADLREVAGSDHVYADVDELALLIGRWQASTDG